MTDHTPPTHGYGCPFDGDTFPPIGESVECTCAPVSGAPPVNGWEGFMCGTDFKYERGEPIDGNHIFANLEDLRTESKCLHECGIAKVKVTLIEWAKEPTI